MSQPAINPKDAAGLLAIPMSIVPPPFIAMTAVGLTNGKYKYGRNNYRASNVILSIYVDALLRHTFDFFEGNWEDPVDKVPNLAGIAASLAIIVDAWYAGTLLDDRNYPGGYVKARTELTPHIGRLKEFHKDRNPKQWTILDAKGEVLSEGQRGTA